MLLVYELPAKNQLEDRKFQFSHPVGERRICLVFLHAFPSRRGDALGLARTSQWPHEPAGCGCSVACGINWSVLIVSDSAVFRSLGPGVRELCRCLLGYTQSATDSVNVD